jgi:hAT family C-terminal dimerisation region
MITAIRYVLSCSDPFIFYLLLQGTGIDHATVTSDNIFDALPSISTPYKASLSEELERYLSAPTEATHDPLLWWVEKRTIYPRLSRMARNYLCIPGESIVVYSICPVPTN